MCARACEYVEFEDSDYGVHNVQWTSQVILRHERPEQGRWNECVCVLPWSSGCVLNWTPGLYGPGPTAVNAQTLTSYTVSAFRPSNNTLDSGAATIASEAFPLLFISLYRTEYFTIFPFCSIRGTDFQASRMEAAEASSEMMFSGNPLGASSGVVNSFTDSSPYPILLRAESRKT